MDNAILDGRPVLAARHQATAAVGAPRTLRRQRGAGLGSDRTRRSAATPRDAAAVIPRESKLHKARVWLVYLVKAFARLNQQNVSTWKSVASKPYDVYRKSEPSWGNKIMRYQ